MMDRTLAREHKTFGGYLAKHYPMFLFTNALFGQGDRDRFHAPKLDRTPGHCVFWDGGGRFPSLDVLPEKQCRAYVQVPWRSLAVCSACY